MDDIIVIGGKTHISSRRVSEMSGYTQDYVTQLVRGKKISGVKIGRSWYVEENSLWHYWSKMNGSLPKNISLSGENFSDKNPSLGNQTQAFSDTREDFSETNLGKDFLPRILKENALFEGKTNFKSKDKKYPISASKKLILQKSLAFALALTLIGSGVAFADTASTHALVDELGYLKNNSGAALVQGFRDFLDDDKLTYNTLISAYRDAFPGEAFAAVASTNENPVSYTARSVAVGVYQTIHPIFAGFGNTVLALFGSKANSNVQIGENAVEAPTTTIAFGQTPVATTTTNVPRVFTSTQSQNPKGQSETTPVVPAPQPIYYQTVGVTSEYVQKQINAVQNTLAAEINALSSRTSVNQAVAQQNVTNVYDNIDLTHVNGSSITNSSVDQSTINGSKITNSEIDAASGEDALNVLGLSTSTIEGDVYFNNNTLAVDATNDRIGIGTTSPAYLLDVAGTEQVENLIISGGTSISGTTALNSYTATNGTTTNATSTNSSITNLSVTNAFAQNLVSTNASSTNFFATNASTTNATSTNIFATNSIFTNATSTNFFANNFTAGSENLANLSATNSTTTGPAYFGSTLAIGTTSPAATLAVNGNGYISGNLTVGGNSITLGNSNTNTLTINSAITSNIVPNQNSMYDLGSPSYYWNNAYIANLNVNNISAASTTIGGTTDNTFTLNSDNATADTESSSIIFYRGTVVPNALISWNSSNKRFELNQAAFIQNASANLLSSPTLTLEGQGGQTGDLFDVASSSGTNYFAVSATGTTEITSLLGVNATTTNATTTNFFTTSLTATNLTFGNQITTNATTTNASSTNLYAANASLDKLSGLAFSSLSTNSVPKWNNGTFVNSLIYDNGTNVGIGSTSPAQIFSVQGNSLISGDITSVANVTATGTLTVGGIARFNGNYIGTDAVGSNPGVLSANGWRIYGSSGNGIRIYGFGTTNDVVLANRANNDVLEIPAGTTNVNVVGSLGVGSTATAQNFAATNASATSTFAGGVTGPNNFTVQQTTGNVGIGVANPTTALQLATNSTINGSNLTVDGAAGTLTLNAGSGQVMNFDINSGLKARLNATGLSILGGNAVNALDVNGGVAIGSYATINTAPAGGEIISGNVGVGTTSPASKFDVGGTQGDLIVNPSTGNSGELSAGPSIYTETGNLNIMAEGQNGTAGKKLTLGYYDGSEFRSALEVANTSGFSNLLLMKSGGNVGIGTTTPNQLLSVAGTIGIGTLGVNNATAAANSTGQLMLSSGGTNQNLVLTPSGNGKVVFSNSNGVAQFTGGSTAGFVDNAGNTRFQWTSASTQINDQNGSGVEYLLSNNLGIGTTSPSTNFSVQGNGLFSGNINAANITATGTLAVGSSVSAPFFTATNASATSTFAGGVTGPNNFTVQQTTGNVGVGTLNPAEKLDVFGGIALSQATSFVTNNAIATIRKQTDHGLVLKGTTGSINDFAITTTGGQLLAVNPTGTNNFVLNASAGNTGIGTTSPSQLLSVAGNGYFTGGLGVGLANTGAGTIKASSNIFAGGGLGSGTSLVGYGAGTLELRSVNGTAPFVQFTEDAAGFRGQIGFNAGSGDMVFQTGGSGFSSGTERLRITSGGNVGIGTSTPSDKLDVNGNIGVLGGSTLSLYNSGNTSHSYIGFDGAETVTNWPFQVNTASGSGGAPALAVIQSSTGNAATFIGGNVGIGTSSPYARLSVALGSSGTGIAEDAASGYSGDLLDLKVASTSKFSVDQAGNTTSLGSVVAYLGEQIKGGSSISFNNPDNTASAAISNIGGTGANLLQFNSSNDYFTGNVGIGTTTPPKALTIQAAGGDLMFNDNTQPSGSGGWIFQTRNTQVFQITSASDVGIGLTPGLNINRSGQIGIGTTSPTAALSISGSSNSGSTAAVVRLDDTSGNANSLNFAIGNSIGPNYGEFDIFQSSSANGNPLSGTDRFDISNTGNIGIGTTSPQDKLQVEGANALIRTQTNSSTGNSFFESLSDNYQSALQMGILGSGKTGTTFGLSNNNLAFLYTNTYSGGAYPSALAIGTNNASPVVFGTNGSENMRIASGGNVGIGTTSPTTKLSVAGNAFLGATFPVLTLDATGNNGSQINFVNQASTPGNWTIGMSGVANSNDFIISDTSSGGFGQAVTVKRATGYVGIGTSTPATALTVAGSSGVTLDAGGGSAGESIVLNSYNSGAQSVDRITTSFTGGLEINTPQGLSITKNGSYNPSVTSNLLDVNGSGVFGSTFLSANASAPTNGLLVQGSVGIGTTTPNNKLSVIGSQTNTQAVDLEIGSAGGSAGVGNGLLFSEAGTAVGEIRTLDDSGNKASLHFDTYNAGLNQNAMVITGPGNVGIGTTTPISRLTAVTASSGAVYPTNAAALFDYGGSNAVVSLAVDSSHQGAYVFSTPNGAYDGAIAYNPNRSMQFSTAGTQQMTILSNGNLGIGTTTPSSKLSVSGNATIGADYDFAAPANGLLVEGAVGIGGVTSPGNSLGESLNVGKSSFTLNSNTIAALIGVNRQNSNVTAGAIGADTSNDFLVGANNAATIFGNWGGGTWTEFGRFATTGFLNLSALAISTTTATSTFSTGGLAIGGNQFVVQQTSGNVGIGTSTPQDKFDIVGSSGTAAANFYSSSGASNSVTIGDGSSAPFVQGETNYGQNTTSLALNPSGGNVGIGTTTPGALLDLYNTAPYLRLTASAGTNYVQQDFVNSGGTVRLGEENSSGGGLLSGTLPYAGIFGTTAAEPLQFSTNNSVRETISSTGNVGIGTSSPSDKLDVTGNIDITNNNSLQIRNSAGAAGAVVKVDTNNVVRLGDINHQFGDVDLISGGSSAGTLVLKSGAPDSSIYVNSSGNVGFGTTTPESKLDIYQSTVSTVSPGLTFSGVLGAVNAGYSIDFKQSNSSTNSFARIAGVTNASGSTGELSFYTSPSLSTQASEVMRINGAGNVGIGTTTPGSKLDVNGVVTIENTTGSVGGIKDQLGMAASSNNLVTGDAAGDLDILTTGRKVNFSNNNGTTNMFTISSSGQIGIGTSTPQRNFVIDGSGSSMLLNNNAAGSAAWMYFGNDTQESSTAIGEGGSTYSGYGGANSLNIVQGQNAPITFNTNGSNERMRITGTGNVGIGTSSPQVKLETVANDESLRVSADALGHNARERIWTPGGTSGNNILDFYDTGVQEWQVGMDNADGSKLKFQAGGAALGSTAQMTIQAGGNVGIGTTSPASTLTVDGITPVFSICASANARCVSIDPGTNGIQSTGNGQILYLNRNVSNNIALAVGGGSVGIGTSTPGGKFEVATAPNNEAGAFLANTMTSGQADWLTLGNTRTTNQAAVVQYTYNSTPANQLLSFDFYNQSNNKLVLTGAGNVGVDTASPAYPLSVYTTGNTSMGVGPGAAGSTGDTLELGYYTNSDYGYIQAVNKGTAYKNLAINPNGGLVGIGTTTPWGQFSINSNGIAGPSFVIGSSTQTNFVVANGGNVGIGTSSPSAALSVASGDIYQTPGIPTIAATMSTCGNMDKPFVIGNYLFAGTQGGSCGSGNTYIYDITNPSSPALLSNLGTDGSGVVGAGRYIYVASSHDLKVFDISNIKSPTLVSTRSFIYGQDFSEALAGNYLYTYSEGGFDVFDTSNPASLPLLYSGTIASGDTSTGGGVYVSGDYAYVVATTINKLIILDISNPSAPIQLGSVSLSGNVNTTEGGQISVVGRYAYIAEFNTSSSIQVVDVSNPNSPSVVETLNGGYDATGVTVAGKYMYVATAPSNGVYIYDISNPTNPKFVNGATVAHAQAITVVGKYAYAGTDNSNGIDFIRTTGIDTPAITTGSIDTTRLNVDNDAYFGSNIFTNGAINAGIGGITSQGKLSVLLASSTDTTSAYFQGQVGIGTTSATQMLAVNGQSYLAGSVGINTANPTSALEVNGDIRITAGSGGHLYFADGSSMITASANGTGITSWNDLNMQTGGNFNVQTGNGAATTTKLMLTNAGLLGLGTTTPWGMLSINPNGISGPEFAIGSSTGTSLVVTNGGNLGIGTSNPGAHVEISSSQGNTGLQFQDGSGSWNIKGYAAASPSTGGTISLYDGSANFTLSENHGGGVGNMIFQTAALERMRITNTGQVGIGTTTPSTTFAVQGNGLFSGNLSVAGITATGTITTDKVSSFTAPTTNFLNLYAAGTAQLAGTSGIIMDSTGGDFVVRSNPAQTVRLTVQGSTGNVGVASSTPWGMLSLNPNGISGPAFVIGSSTATIFKVGTNGQTLIGSLGTTISPTNGLIITGNDDGAGDNGGIGAGISLVQTGTSGTQWNILSTNASNGSGAGKLVFFGGGAGTTNSTLTLTSGGSSAPGFVGIGTANPIAALDITNHGASTSPAFILRDSTGADTFEIQASTSTADNVFLGLGAATTTGLGVNADNVAVGYQAFLTAGTIGNTAIGYRALTFGASGSDTAIGAQALQGVSGTGAGLQNTAIGASALSINTGSSNFAGGYVALQNNTTGNFNVAIGSQALNLNITGSQNVAIGEGTLSKNISATSTTAIGYLTAGNLTGNYYNQGGVYVGAYAGYRASNSSDFNTFIGYGSGYTVTTGYDNIMLGAGLVIGGSHLTTGANNICISYNCMLPDGATANNELNIGNFIFANNLTATSSGTTLPGTFTGNLGLGTTSPSATFAVNGNSFVSGTSTVGNLAIALDGELTVGGNVLIDSSGNLNATVLPLEDTAANLAAVVPLQGQMVYETDTKESLVGDGVTDVAGLSPLLGGGPVKNGLGTSSPYATLSIVGQLNQNYPYLAMAQASSTVPGGSLSPFFQIASSTGFKVDGGVINPELVSTTSVSSNITGTGMNFGSTFIRGSYAYSAVSNAGGSGGFEIDDISNPQNIVHVGTLTNGQGGATLAGAAQVVVSGNYAYVLDSTGSPPGLEIIDISNPANPVHKAFLGAINSGFWNASSIVVSGKYAYITGYFSFSPSTAGLAVVDISNPSSPKTVAFLENSASALLNNADAVSVQGNYAYVVSKGSNALQIINITNPLNPIAAGSITNGTGGALLNQPTSISVQGSYAYIGSLNAATLQIINISNPNNPTVAGSISGGVGSTFVSGNYLYIKNGTNLSIYDISSSTNPVLKGASGGGVNSSVGSVMVQGNYAYVSTGVSAVGLQIFDVGGATIANTQIGNASINNLQVQNSAQFNQDLSIMDGLNVGTNALIGGMLSVTGLSSTTAATTTAQVSATFIGGNVGIGTTSPLALLDVVSTSNNQMALFNIASSTNGLATSTVLYVTANGNVGLGTTTPGSTLTIGNGSLCVDQGTGATLACGNAAGNIYYKTANTGSYDVAEDYAASDLSIGAGDIVALDPQNPLHIVKATKNADVFGIVSSDPGIILGGSDIASAESSSTRPVALSGRVPVKVSLENGPISIGDKVTISSTSGVAMKASSTSPETIGIALEPFTGLDNASSTIDVFVRFDSSNQVTNIASRVTTLESEVASLTSLIASSTATTTVSTSSPSDLTGWFSSLGVTIENNIFHFTSLIADSLTVTTEYVNTITADTVNAATVNASSMTVGSSTAPESSGITLYDRSTGKPYCVFIFNGTMQSVLGACANVASGTYNPSPSSSNNSSNGSSDTTENTDTTGTTTSSSDTSTATSSPSVTSTSTNDTIGTGDTSTSTDATSTPSSGVTNTDTSTSTNQTIIDSGTASSTPSSDTGTSTDATSTTP